MLTTEMLRNGNTDLCVEELNSHLTPNRRWTMSYDDTWAINILKKQSRPADKGWSFQLGGLGEVLTTPHRKTLYWCETVKKKHTCDCGNEPSSSTKCGEFLNKLKTC